MCFWTFSTLLGMPKQKTLSKARVGIRKKHAGNCYQMASLIKSSLTINIWRKVYNMGYIDKESIWRHV